MVAVVGWQKPLPLEDMIRFIFFLGLPTWGNKWTVGTLARFTPQKGAKTCKRSKRSKRSKRTKRAVFKPKGIYMLGYLKNMDFVWFCDDPLRNSWCRCSKDKFQRPISIPSQSQYTKQNLKPSGFPAINNLSLVNLVEMIETRSSLMTVRRETIVSKFCCFCHAGSPVHWQ